MRVNIANMRTDSAITQNILHVNLLWLPDAMHGTLLGAVDVLRTAAGILRLRQPDSPCALSWRILTPAGRTVALPDTVPSEYASGRVRKVDPGYTLLFVPALHAHNAPHVGDIADRSKAVLNMLEQHASAGGWIATMYTSLIFPARLGLLDGARVGAPWAYQSWFAGEFPHYDFSGSEPIASHGRLFNCMVPALQTEFMLTMLGHLLDPQLAQACANVLLYQPRRQQLTPEMVEQKWLTRTADSPVYRAMQWLQTHLEQPYRLAAVADAAATSERTLLRHFRQVVGMTPLDYLHGLRIERAKMLLEATLHDTHAIAAACGYADAASFRRLFRRAAGMSPTQYRERFALRSRRQRWRVEEVRAKNQASPSD
ncbi:MAG: GlxA family transcriptional regulator [Noviherbaspirillum sp.]